MLSDCSPIVSEAFQQCSVHTGHQEGQASYAVLPLTSLSPLSAHPLLLSAGSVLSVLCTGVSVSYMSPETVSEFAFPFAKR